jgi:hypothetical protein
MASDAFDALSRHCHEFRSAGTSEAWLASERLPPRRSGTAEGGRRCLLNYPSVQLLSRLVVHVGHVSTMRPNLPSIYDEPSRSNRH